MSIESSRSSSSGGSGTTIRSTTDSSAPGTSRCEAFVGPVGVFMITYNINWRMRTRYASTSATAPKSAGGIVSPTSAP